MEVDIANRNATPATDGVEGVMGLRFVWNSRKERVGKL